MNMKHQLLLFMISCFTFFTLTKGSSELPPQTPESDAKLPFDSNYLKVKDRLPRKTCPYKAQEGSIVTFWSDGYMYNGELFDRGEYEIKIGNNEAPKGVDVGLRGLCPGDQRRMFIHPSWAYGYRGLYPRMPYANARVVYDVVVLKVLRENQKRVGLLMNKFLNYTDTNTVKDCGLRVKEGDKVKIYLVGSLTNGIMAFRGYNNPTMGAREVIIGVDLGMRGMCVGGKRRMIMHHSYAFGPMGRGKVPAYANLITDVEVKRIVRSGVGWEDLELKRRTTASDVNSLNPMKIIGSQNTVGCEFTISAGTVVKRNTYGYLLNGVIIFEEIGVETTVGDGKSLHGVEDGLLGLCAGDKRSLVLHSDMAYGRSGISDKVPINAPVIVDIEVLDVKNMWEHEETLEEYRKYAEVAPVHHDDGMEFHSHSHHVVT